MAVDYLVTVGNLAQWIARGGVKGGLHPGRVRQCENNDQAVEFLKDILQHGDTILVKGSRGMRMEEIVKELVKDNRE